MCAKSTLVLIVVLFQASLATAQVGKFEMVKIAEGVFAALRTDPLHDPVDGNSIVIINDDDVIVVDTNVTPDSAREVIAQIRKLTNKPVRYVINTHWHDDHIFGNQTYQQAFSQVEFIGHPNTRVDMIKEVVPNMKGYKTRYQKYVTDYSAFLAKGQQRNGDPLTESQKTEISQFIEKMKWLAAQLEQTHLVLPTITVEKELTLHRGSRVIKIFHPGRGNTRGDLVVYLPQEKVLITGDLLVNPVPFSIGSYLGDWIQTLKKLRAMEVNVILPGHGPAQHNWEYLDLIASLLGSVLQQTQDAVKRGLSLEDTRKAVDLESFRIRIAGDDQLRNAAFKEYFVTPAVERAYKEAKGEIEKE